jgi:hypothetical protein
MPTYGYWMHIFHQLSPNKLNLSGKIFIRRNVTKWQLEYPLSPISKLTTPIYKFVFQHEARDEYTIVWILLKYPWQKIHQVDLMWKLCCNLVRLEEAVAKGWRRVRAVWLNISVETPLITLLNAASKSLLMPRHAGKYT